MDVKLDWKKEYIPWYRMAEETLPKYIPKLSDEKIIEKVSPYNWLMIPINQDEKVSTAKNRETAKHVFQP